MTGLSFDEVLSERKDQLSDDGVLDCGTIVFDSIEESKCEEDFATRQCLLNAYQRCEPAELRLERYTIEGATIPSVWLVGGKNEDGCGLSRFTDYSADRFRGDYGPRVEESCSEPQLLDVACIALEASCQTVEEW